MPSETPLRTRPVATHLSDERGEARVAGGRAARRRSEQLAHLADRRASVDVERSAALAQLERHHAQRPPVDGETVAAPLVQLAVEYLRRCSGGRGRQIDN